ncbi:MULTISPECIES: hypothetical protein [unclassified Streptomyces]|uniref:hypothetical protein n=1 Tax=unclassified Streptomyces TaxID=2593676 RepID=UPI0036EF1F2C
MNQNKQGEGPRPPGPVTLTARVTGGAFPRKTSSRTKAAEAIGVAHQRTANDLYGYGA